LTWIAFALRFWSYCSRNTMRKVTIVVPVLIASCQVSLKPNAGPEKAQTTTSASATMNAQYEPTMVAAQVENRLKRSLTATGFPRYAQENRVP
jgi:hypothetical protein